MGRSISGDPGKRLPRRVSIAGGTNYKDKLYLGAVLGIQWTYDKQRILYSEIAEENAPSLLDFYEFRQYRRTRVRGSI